MPTSSASRAYYTDYETVGTIGEVSHDIKDFPPEASGPVPYKYYDVHVRGRISPQKFASMFLPHDEGAKLESLRYVLRRYSMDGDLFIKYAGEPYGIDEQEVFKDGQEE